MDRRSLLRGIVCAAAALPLHRVLQAAPGSRVVDGFDGAGERLAQLEYRYGARLGVAIMDTGSGRQVGHRADERFLMCSTFKWLAVAAVLARVDQGTEQLTRRITFDKDVLLDWAPVTSGHVGAPGLSVEQLCQAAITVSDNTAANLLLHSLGGPAAVTGFMRSLGDPVTRLDRIEPELNLTAPGDLRDTTTPAAMLADLSRLLLGTVLSHGSRTQLDGWLRACTTGLEKLRAGLPTDWVVGDKTGSGAQGESNDVAIIWPPQRAPLLVAAYHAPARKDAHASQRALADVGRIVASL